MDMFFKWHEVCCGVIHAVRAASDGKATDRGHLSQQSFRRTDVQVFLTVKNDALYHDTRQRRDPTGKAAAGDETDDFAGRHYEGESYFL